MAPTDTVGAFFVDGSEVALKVLAIGAAGFAGAISRYAVEGWVSSHTRGHLPWGTFVVNVTGCFVLGFLFALLTERFMANATLRTAMTVGFVGAYTTFSTFAFETMRLAQDGAFLAAAGNVALSVAAGLAAVYAGTWLGRVL
jgi:CrcB protein